MQSCIGYNTGYVNLTSTVCSFKLIPQKNDARTPTIVSCQKKPELSIQNTPLVHSTNTETMGDVAE